MVFSRLDWYFLRKFSIASLVTGLLFFSLLLMVKMLEFVDSPLAFWDILVGAGLHTFSMLNGYVTTIIFLGFLFAFGGMANNREIVVIQALGFSYARLLSMVIKGVFAVLLFWWMLMEGFAPVAQSYSKRILTEERQVSDMILSRGGHWLKSGRFFVNVSGVVDTQVFDVLVYEMDSKFRLLNWYQAKHGYWLDNQLLLEKALHKRYFYDKQGDNSEKATERRGLEALSVKQQILPETTLELKLDKEVLSYLALLPEQMYLWQLLFYSDYIQANDLQGGADSKFVFAFWQRLFMPLAVFGLILIFMPMMLGTPRVQKVSDRIFWGVIIGAMYYVLIEAMRSSSNYFALSPMLLASLVPWVLFVTGSWYTWKSR